METLVAAKCFQGLFLHLIVVHGHLDAQVLSRGDFVVVTFLFFILLSSCLLRLSLLLLLFLLSLSLSLSLKPFSLLHVSLDLLAFTSEFPLSVICNPLNFLDDSVEHSAFVKPGIFCRFVLCILSSLLRGRLFRYLLVYTFITI